MPRLSKVQSLPTDDTHTVRKRRLAAPKTAGDVWGILKGMVTVVFQAQEPGSHLPHALVPV